MKQTKIRWILSLALIGCLAALALPALAQEEEEEFTEEFDLDDCKFSHKGRNAYFSLVPGDQLILEGEDEEEELRVQITVLDEHRWITFENDEDDVLSVKTRVIEEREWVDGEIAEISRNFFARCKQTNAIYYFGEGVDIYEDGEIVSHDGAWLAGVDEALPGLIMPGTFLMGSRYMQEIAPGIALDRAEHVAMGEEMEVPAGLFDECVEVYETSGLDPEDESTKIYCEEVGLVVDDEVELVEYTIAADDDDDDDELDGQ